MKKYVWFNKLYVRKKDSFHVDLVWTWQQIELSPRCAGQWWVTALTIPLPTRLLWTLPLHCLTCGGKRWCWSICRGLLSEQHFHLFYLWVYFIRWLLLIGAFWLYSAHLGSLWAGWHVSQILWGSSRTTIHSVVASEASPRDPFLFSGYFCWFIFVLLKTMAFSFG